jgi:hypothetical protein
MKIGGQYTHNEGDLGRSEGDSGRFPLEIIL